jgi:hypothetical protein
VTANYKLTFDIVRRDLDGMTCWILALDTGGIGVWSASSGGTFSTEELVTRLGRTRLADVVSHRQLILPRHGAAGVDARLVLEHSGFTVRFGPLRSTDLPAFLVKGESTSAMLETRFSLIDRLILTPLELAQSLKKFAVFVLAAFLYSGSTPTGVAFDKGWSDAWPLYALGLGAVLAGSFLAPLLLPWIPLRPISAKGWAAGAAVSAALLYGAGLARGMDPFLTAACLLFFPAAAAFMSFTFAGAAPDQDPSGVRREGRVFFPLFIAAAVIAAAALVLSKLKQWGVV